jgi:hypothetical protein
MGDIKLIREDEILPKVAIDILLEDSPVATITTHLNRAYIHMDFPSGNATNNKIDRVSVGVYKYGSTPEGNIDLENILDIEYYYFIPGASVVYSKNDPSIPEHNVYLDIENYWYCFELAYVSEPTSNEVGGNMFYSLLSKYYVDNRYPSIYVGYISKYIIDFLKNAFEDNHKLTVFYNVIEPINPKKFDLIRFKDSISYKLISEIYETGSQKYQLEPVSGAPLDLIIKLTLELNFGKCIYDFFEKNIPEYGQIPFIIKYNFSTYNLVFDGDMPLLASKYLESENIDG